jgi:hypothetical protein
MGSANSAPTQEHVVTLHSHVSRKVQVAMMDKLRARGVRIGLVVYSPPLGFVADITEEERMHILANENVSSVVNDEERPDEEEEAEDLWLHMLSCGLQSHRPRGDSRSGYRFCVYGGTEQGSSGISTAPRRPFPPLSNSEAPLVESAVMTKLAVTAFARRLAPATTDAITATRFLRSRGLRRITSVDEVDALASDAVTMYLASLAWRKAEGIDELLKTDTRLDAAAEALLRKNFNPRILKGVDFHGRPVLYFQPSDIDFDELIAHGITEKMLILRFVKTMEQLMPLIYKSNDPLRGHFAVYDVGRLSIYNALCACSFWLTLGRTLEAYYPESLGKLLVVNAPMGSGRAFEHFKSYLAPASVHKVALASCSAREALAGVIPTKMIPSELLGGPGSGGGGDAMRQTSHDDTYAAANADEPGSKRKKEGWLW